MNLREIGARCGTDKENPHRYLSLYEALFREIALLPKPRILEIGVQFGYSLQTWLEYFPSARVTGIDNEDHGVKLERSTIIIGDAYKPDTIATFFTGREFDLIIDDGSHLPFDQVFVAEHYPTLLSPVGLLIIEDILDPNTFNALKYALRPEFDCAAVETEACRHVSVDSRLFIAWRTR